MLDQAAGDAFLLGFGFGIFVLALGWSLLSVIHFAKSVLSGVQP